jgi:outer membrane receptor for ferric coprogen and ferric-rhodotorulic acid
MSAHAPRHPALAAAIATILASPALAGATDADPATAASASSGVLEEIFVVAERERRVSRGAVVLPLPLIDTPQAVSVIDREAMDAFGLDDANRLLGLVTGVNVEEVETDRTYYNSRGFDIKSMQVDGIGLPFNWNVVGALDTVVYDKVEVIRGANGLLTGTGNPSGTINYVRKRPTNVLQAAAEATFGAWDERRLEFDVSGPFTDSGRWAGRFVGATQSADSYLDLYSSERTIVYGVVEGQVGERSALTIGYTQQDNAAKGVLWGALPLLYSDGNQTDFDTSTTTSMDWTRWDTHSRTAFAELAHEFDGGWKLLTTATWNDYEEPSQLFYVYGAPDRDTGLGLYGWPGKFESTVERMLFDGTLSGKVRAGGREHDVTLGVSISHADNFYWEQPAAADDPAWGELPAFPGWSGRAIARPAFGERVKASDWQIDVRRVFGVAHVDATDVLKVLLGFNAIDVESSGYSFDEPQDSDDRKLSPYVGVTWRIADALQAYASYSDIYEPQPEVGADLRPLGAAEGRSYELGLKGELLDRRLLASVSLFRAEQVNYAEYAGFDVDSGISYYEGIDVESEGVELEASGRLNDRWTLQAGFTYLDLTDAQGEDARTFVPRKTFNLGTRYRPRALPGLELGATLKWRDDIHLDNGLGVIRQDAFTLASLHASYAVNRNLELALNVDNVTDEKYLTSLYWDQAFYGAPRHASVAFRYRY